MDEKIKEETKDFFSGIGAIVQLMFNILVMIGILVLIIFIVKKIWLFF